MVLLFVCAQGAAQDIRTLMDLPLEKLMQVDVSVASKRPEDKYDAPGIITVITREEVLGFAAENLGQVLNRVVGASFLTANVYSDNLVQFRAQSLTPYNSHVLILLNGRPMRDPMSGGLNSPVYTAFPVQSIDHIEIIRGPGSVLYGSCAYSGVINIITNMPSEDSSHTEFQAGAGTMGTFFQSAGIRFKKKEFKGALSLFHLNDNGPEYSFTGYEDVSGSGRFDRECLGITGSARYRDFSMNFYAGGFFPYALSGSRITWNGRDPSSSVNQNMLFIDAGYKKQVNPSCGISVNTTYNMHMIDAEGDAEIFGEDMLVEGTVRITKGSAHILAGALAQGDRYRGDLFHDGSSLVLAMYAQADIRVNTVKFIGGMQFNKIEGVAGNLSPRIGAVVPFTANAGMKLLYSQAFRRAYPFETSFNHPLFKGDLHIRPELIRTAEAQIFYHVKRFQSSVTVYASRMLDIISRRWVDDPASPIGEYVTHYNAGTHDFAGIEAEGQWYAGSRVFVTGSFYVQKNRNDAGIDNAALHPGTMAKLGVLYNARRFSAGVYACGFGRPFPVSTVNPGVKEVNPEAEAYTLVSAKVSVKPFRNVNISVMANNLLDLDIRYPEYTTRGVNTLIPLYSGRKIWAAVSYSVDCR